MTNWIKRGLTNPQLYYLIIWLALERNNGVVGEPREKVSQYYRVPRKLIIAGAVVNAIIDLLFIKNLTILLVAFIYSTACSAHIWAHYFLFIRVGIKKKKKINFTQINFILLSFLLTHNIFNT